MDVHKRTCLKGYWGWAHFMVYNTKGVQHTMLGHILGPGGMVHASRILPRHVPNVYVCLLLLFALLRIL